MKLDDRLVELGFQWSISSLINPINLRDTEEDKWLRNWKPQYKEIDFDRLIRAYEDVLYHFDEYEYDKMLRSHYISKIYGCLKYLYAFKDRNSKKITALHNTTPVDLMHNHSDELLEINKLLIDYSIPADVCSADYCEGYLQSYMDDNNIPYVVEQRDIIAKCSVTHKSKKLYVNPNATFSHGEIKRLIQHEIGVHIQRALWGKELGYLYENGFADYIELEEGLAVYNELTSGLREGLVRTYLRMIACELCVDNTFEDMVKKLEHQFPKIDPKMIYDTCFRIKRGLKDFNDYGGYTKDRLYLSGYLKLQDLFKSNPDINIEKLISSGKTNFEYWEK